MGGRPKRLASKRAPASGSTSRQDGPGDLGPPRVYSTLVQSWPLQRNKMQPSTSSVSPLRVILEL